MRMRYFGPATPTSTTVEVGRLGGLDFMIEMESIALVTELLSAAAARNSETAHQSDEAALNLDAVGSEDAGLIGLVGGVERDRGAAAAQPLQGDLLIVDQGDDDAAAFGGVAALYDHCVAIQNTGLDHAVAGHFEGVMLAAAAQQAGGDPPPRALVAQCLDRSAGGDPAVERQVHCLDIVRDGCAGQRIREIAANDRGREPPAFSRRQGNGRLLRQFYDFQRPRAMRQPSDKPALLKPADQAVDAGFGFEVQSILHLVEGW